MKWFTAMLNLTLSVFLLANPFCQIADETANLAEMYDRNNVILASQRMIYKEAATQVKSNVIDYHMKVLSRKPVSEYTLEDCRTILTANNEDILSAFGINSQKDICGLLLSGQDIAVPGYYLTNGVFIWFGTAELFVDAEFPNELYPCFIEIVTSKESETLLNGFYQGMILDENQYSVSDTFFKLSEGGDRLPAKKTQIYKDQLFCEAYFIKMPTSKEFALDSIRVFMVKFDSNNPSTGQ